MASKLCVCVLKLADDEDSKLHLDASQTHTEEIDFCCACVSNCTGNSPAGLPAWRNQTHRAVD